MSNEKLVQHLKDWIAQAEASGIKVLQDFAASLRGYAMQPADWRLNAATKPAERRAFCCAQQKTRRKAGFSFVQAAALTHRFVT